ncbi:MAG: tripartite tricarboxylate transporter permease [Ectothiorhodospiraceae bacterium]|nr:tripartite tricarboxylate transporter permease [Ectothiorhodospiraceae bacterium]
MWEAILGAVQVNLQWSHLLVVLIGTVAGTVIGALPGLSAVSGVALLLPFTFTMDPAQGLIMLAAVYMSAEYGGSISAILINTPGTSGAACTTLDGTPLTRQGYAQEALYTSLLAGGVGGVFGAAVLLFFTPPLAEASLLLGPAEIFWVAVAGLALVAGLSGRHTVKGLVGVSIGVGLTLVGQDAMSGDMRFTFDNFHLVGGIPIVPALLGLFAVATVLEMLERANDAVAPLVLRKGALRFVINKLARMKGLLLYTSAVGTGVGVIPGAGASISAFVAYAEAKRISKHPEEFGRGSYEGIAAPECANNAVVGGALVPLLALGIPGSGSAAIMFSALTVHGLLPGPRLFTERADIAYTFMVGLMVTVFAMLLFGLATIRWSSLVVKAPRRMMVPAVMVLSVIGTYGYANSLYDVAVLIAMGIVGYLLSKVDVPMVTVALGLVLGALVEESFQQSAIIGEVDVGSVWMYFLSRPLAVVLMLLAVGVTAVGVVQIVRMRRAPGDDEVVGVTAGRTGISLRAANIGLGVLLLGLAVFALSESRAMSDLGARFPILVSVVFIALAVLLLAVNLHPATGRSRAGVHPFRPVPWGNWCFVVVALVLMALGASWVGFYEAALVFLLVVAWKLDASSGSWRQRLRAAALFALGYDAIIYLAFKVVLEIPTPPGLLV